MATLEPLEREKIIAFLRALDLKTSRGTTLYIIGGAAVTLAYAPDNRTSDIDVIGANEEVVANGGKDSELASEFGVYISPLDEITFSVPTGWKDRCELQDLGLNELVVKTADRYDIVLGKIARLEPRDIEDINAMHEKHGLDMELLLNRLNDNLGEVKNSQGYRNNAKMLFRLLGRSIDFKSGEAEFFEI